MSSQLDVLADSPVDFETAVAYALSPVMRRLLILYVLGAVLTPAGLAYLDGQTLPGLVVGPIAIVVGLAFLFAGVVGVLFKVVTDANRLANVDTGAD
jgi:hypothetical protein